MSAKELEGLEGIGPIIARSIATFFSQPRNQRVIDRLKAAGVDPVAPPKARGGALEGKTFVITGTLEDYSRDQATRAIEQRGGKVTSSVSKKTSYVIVGVDPGASKLAKATSLGLATLDEKGFTELLG